MDICIGNYGIFLEMIGFVLLLAGVRNRFAKMTSYEINRRRPESKKKKIVHWLFNNVRDLGIIFVISGLVMQFSQLNKCGIN